MSDLGAYDGGLEQQSVGEREKDYLEVKESLSRDFDR
jgi:hypothetical protein